LQGIIFFIALITGEDFGDEFAGNLDSVGATAAVPEVLVAAALALAIVLLGRRLSTDGIFRHPNTNPMEQAVSLTGTVPAAKARPGTVTGISKK